MTSEAPFEEDDDGVSAQHQHPAPTRPKRARTKPPKRAKRVALTEPFIEELKGLWETGHYSQQQLVNYAAGRGIKISQAYVSRLVADRGWVKGSRREELEKGVREQIIGETGETIRKMLEMHGQASRLALGECILHFKNASARRQVDPNFAIAPALLRQLISAMNESMVMEGRAIGFDIKTGRPLANDDEDSADLTELSMSVMSEDQEAELRRLADEAYEQEAAGGGDELLDK